jgi:hypothetical protein
LVLHQGGGQSGASRCGSASTSWADPASAVASSGATPTAAASGTASGISIRGNAPARRAPARAPTSEPMKPSLRSWTARASATAALAPP